jgi:hypothetical protein
MTEAGWAKPRAAWPNPAGLAVSDGEAEMGRAVRHSPCARRKARPSPLRRLRPLPSAPFRRPNPPPAALGTGRAEGAGTGRWSSLSLRAAGRERGGQRTRREENAAGRERGGPTSGSQHPLPLLRRTAARLPAGGQPPARPRFPAPSALLSCSAPGPRTCLGGRPMCPRGPPPAPGSPIYRCLPPHAAPPSPPPSLLHSTPPTHGAHT